MFFFLSCFTVRSESDGVKKLENAVKSLASGAKKAWTGVKSMGQSFGASPGYKYNALVWNDSPVYGTVGIEDIVQVMEMDFGSSWHTTGLVAPFTNTGSKFYEQPLYLQVHLAIDPKQKNNIYGLRSGTAITVGGVSDKKFDIEDNAIESLPVLTPRSIKKDDPNVYFYRFYRDTKSVKGEYLQWGGTQKILGKTKEFLGTFYNSTKRNDIYVKFQKDGKKHAVCLEAGSFNMLQSTQGKTESIRPLKANVNKPEFGFQFYSAASAQESGQNIAYYPLAQEAPAYVYNTEKNEKKPPKYMVGSARPYTFELFDTNGVVNLACHSMVAGRYPLPGTPKKKQVRDLNPVKCNIWVQTADDVEQQMLDAVAKDKTGTLKMNYSQIPYDIPEQIWVTYYTKDSSISQKLKPGVNEIAVVRPRLSEEKVRLFICSLQTTDDQKAQWFLSLLADGTIGMQASHKEVADLTKVKVSDALDKLQPNTYGMVVDSKDQSGVTGTILATDSFMPSGLGSAERFYFVYPTQLQTSVLAGMLPFAGDKQPDFSKKVFSDQLIRWIAMYIKQGEQAVKEEVVSYVQKNGAATIFNNPKAAASSRTIITQVETLLDHFISGKISIKNPPIIRNAGMSYVIVGTQPPGWPKETAKTS